MAEQIIADLSGGLNLSGARDKIPERELLVADYCRFDESGNLQVCGASTKQNSTAYSDGSNLSIWSLRINPTVRHAALVGNDVVAGSALSGLSALLDEVNSAEEKTRFAERQQRVFFDTNGTPRFVDANDGAHAVDWPAPNAGVTTTNGPNSGGTFANDGGSGTAWLNPSNAASSDDSYATATIAHSGQSQAIHATNFGFAVTGTILGVKVEAEFRHESGGEMFDSLFATLIIGGTPTGTLQIINGIDAPSDAYQVFGSSSNLWGNALTAAQVNASNFGVAIFSSHSGSGFSPLSADHYIDHIRITVYTTTQLTAALGAVGNPNGTYTWKVTFADSDGNESEASEASNSLVVTNNAVSLTNVGTGDSKTVKRYIYRKGGSLSFYYRVGEIADNATTTFTDNLSDSDALADGILLAGEAEGDRPNTRIGASIDVKYPCFYYDRLFWARQDSGHRNRIIWSKTTHPFAYPASLFFDVGDEKPVTGLVPFLDDLIIFKTDSIWRLSGNTESGFILSKTPAAVGCDMPFTIVRMQDRIMFTNSAGLWYFDGVTARKSTNRLDKFFDGQEWNSVRAISTASAVLNLHEAVVSDNAYYLLYSDNDVSCNNILVVDLEGGTIARWPTAARSIATDPVTQDIYIGDASGFIRKLDSSTNDAGSGVAFAAQTKYFDQQRGENKQYDAIEIDIDTSGQDITPTVYFNDGASSATLTAINTTARERVYRPIPASAASRRGRNISVKLAGTVTTINENNQPAVTLSGIKIHFDSLKQRPRVSRE